MSIGRAMEMLSAENKSHDKHFVRSFQKEKKRQ